MTDETLQLLRAARQAEKEQALFYRALSTQAEEQELLDDVEALNGLLADEQHHLSRISVRLVELGHDVDELRSSTPDCTLQDWRTAARAREQQEIARYQALLATTLDEETRSVLNGILATEREHERHLAGKYTEA